MKNSKKEIAPDRSSTSTRKIETTKKKGVQKEANSSFPQEYEEQQNIDIRMKPQPLVKPKKK